VTQTAEVFLSYSREDKARVLELAGRLKAAGVSLWIDQGSIDGAALWGESIVRALEGAKVLLLAVSPAAVNSHNVAKEVMLASERKGRILPVHLEPTTIPLALKYPLAGIQHIELYDGDPDEKIEAVLRSLTALGVTIQAVRAAASGTVAVDASAAGHAEVRRGASPAPGAATSDTRPERGAVAVLPFDNISPDAETDYFSDGLTEELIARLSLVSEINLISRWASMQFKGRAQDPTAIGNALGARYIVGGGVRRFQDSVRITVQLVDVATNLQLWGNTYKGKLDDIFDIQEQVAQQIVEALKLKLSFAEKVSLTKRPTLNAEAYDLYLRGQDQLYRLTKRSVEYAIQLFEKAIELDSRYASAYAGCSSAYGQMYQLISREERYRELAQELSFKALMYDNNLPEAYRAMGLSYFLWGKLNEATASCTKAVEIDPDDFIAHWTLGRIYFTEGKLEQARDLFRRVIDIKPSFYAGHLDMAQSCSGLGLAEDAEAAYRKLLEILPNYLLQNPDDARARLIYASQLGRVGRREEAIREGTKALVLSPGDPVMLYNAACMYVRIDEQDRAIESLRQAVAAGYCNFGWMQNDPTLAPLRGNPAFEALKTPA
jgi:TolB-like protein/Tfp pilus assembly protein PilF